MTSGRPWPIRNRTGAVVIGTRSGVRGDLGADLTTQPLADAIKGRVSAMIV